MKNILIISLIIGLFSCGKKDSTPQAPVPTATIISHVRLCTGANCGQLRFNYRVTYPEQVRSLQFRYQSQSVPVTVQASGSFQVNSVPTTITGFFVITTISGQVLQSNPASYN